MIPPVLVEFDNADWKRREWIRVYEDPFAAFLVEETLTWHVRNPDETPSPALVSEPPPSPQPLPARGAMTLAGCPPHHGRGGPVQPLSACAWLSPRVVPACAVGRSNCRRVRHGV
ncbi:uncharacterized protein LOC144133212 isoform X2 [Amblyomma americanum]